jgi:hypothetical protein
MVGEKKSKKNLQQKQLKKDFFFFLRGRLLMDKFIDFKKKAIFFSVMRKNMFFSPRVFLNRRPVKNIFLFIF